jgi:hypothetical protein
MSASEIERKMTPPRGGIVVNDFAGSLWDEIGERGRFQIVHGRLIIWCTNPREGALYPDHLEVQVALVQAGFEDKVEVNENRTTLVNPVEYQQPPSPERVTLPPPPPAEIVYLSYVQLEHVPSAATEHRAARVLKVLEEIPVTVDAASPWRLWIHILGVDGFRLLVPTDETIV